MARESTVVFNAIDHGEYFDYAVTSLCKALRLPYATASSYAHTAIAEGFSGREVRRGIYHVRVPLGSRDRRGDYAPLPSP